VVVLCDPRPDTAVESSAELVEKDGVTGIVIRLPVMKPLEQQVPAELERYRKYVQPEPFRPATILSAVHDLEVYLGDLGGKDDSDASRPVEEEARMRRAKAFVTITLDFIVRVPRSLARAGTTESTFRLGVPPPLPRISDSSENASVA
jgi:hypothetical protein